MLYNIISMIYVGIISYAFFESIADIDTDNSYDSDFDEYNGFNKTDFIIKND